MQDEMNDLQMPYTDPAPGDLVRVCRCADCDYWKEIMNGKGICKVQLGFRSWWKKIDYCSYGERKDE